MYNVTKHYFHFLSLQGRVWGVAFEVVGRVQIQQAMDHLGMRECLLGGYNAEIIPFHLRGSYDQTVPVVVFNALPDNPHFLGPAALDDLANQVVSSKGPCGHNVEYVTRLAEFVRHQIPEDSDEHLFDLESHIMKLLHAKNISLENLYDININYTGYVETSSLHIDAHTLRKMNFSGSHPVSKNKQIPGPNKLFSSNRPVLLSQSL